MQDRRRDVDHVDEAVFPRRRGAEQAGREPGSAHRNRGQRRALLRGHRTHDDDRVTFPVDVVEEPADERVRVVQRVGTEPRALLVGCETSGQISAHQIGTLHEHDGAAGPRSAKRVEHLIRVEPETERRPGIGLEELAVDASSRHLSFVGHQGRDRAPSVRRHPVLRRARVGAVAVGDHGTGDAGLRQLVAEQTDLRAVELAVVLVDDVVDRHVHEAAAGRGARAGREDTPRTVAPELLVDAEALACGLPSRRRARARTERHIVAADRAGANDAVGDQPTDRRLGEQPVEVRQVDALQIGPLDVRERDDEHARDGLGARAARCAVCRSREQGEHGYEDRGTCEGDAPHCARSGSSFRPSPRP